MTYKDCIDLYASIISQALPSALVFWIGGKILSLFRNALDGELSWD